MLTTWNYERSVETVSAKLKEWKTVSLRKETLTVEIVKELHEAREQLSNSGFRSDLVPNDTRLKTWANYLEAVGLARRTVHRWLESYDPEEQKLLTDEELEARKRETRRLEMEREQATKDKVDERIKKGYIPDDWDDEAEEAYRKRLEQTRKTEEWKKRIWTQSAEREQQHESAFEEIDDLFEKMNSQIQQRVELSNKIRLTGDNAGHAFNEMLIDYLESLSSNSERLEACHNGIKIFKAYIREYQKKSVEAAHGE